MLQAVKRDSLIRFDDSQYAIVWECIPLADGTYEISTNLGEGRYSEDGVCLTNKVNIETVIE